MALDLPLFPLHTVLFPGGPLPLRIFEPRYLDMVSRCLREDRGIGVVLIREGSETGPAPEVHDLGTLGRIHYWNRRDDGLLGVTLVGDRRFRILDSTVQPDQLVCARVELLPPERTRALPRRYQPLAGLLRDVMRELEPPWTTLPQHYEDAGWVSGRLAELLPIPLDMKQALLALDDPLLRLDGLQRMLRQLDTA